MINSEFCVAQINGRLFFSIFTFFDKEKQRSYKHEGEIRKLFFSKYRSGTLRE
jgi:hypothetical protein